MVTRATCIGTGAAWLRRPRPRARPAPSRAASRVPWARGMRAEDDAIVPIDAIDGVRQLQLTIRQSRAVPSHAERLIAPLIWPRQRSPPPFGNSISTSSVETRLPRSIRPSPCPDRASHGARPRREFPRAAASRGRAGRAGPRSCASRICSRSRATGADARTAGETAAACSCRPPSEQQVHQALALGRHQSSRRARPAGAASHRHRRAPARWPGCSA